MFRFWYYTFWANFPVKHQTFEQVFFSNLTKYEVQISNNISKVILETTLVLYIFKLVLYTDSAVVNNTKSTID